MSITNEAELIGMQKVSEAVGMTLKQMKAYAKAGMSTKELDDYGAKLLKAYGAKSAPFETYGFPGYTCISVNEEAAHGIPSKHKILKEGDLINIDVSAELNGFWSDNGGSFIVGEDKRGLQKLVNASQEILNLVIPKITNNVRISDIGGMMRQNSCRIIYVMLILWFLTGQPRA